MLPVYSFFLLTLVSFSYENPLPTLSPVTANAYLRSFLPWWPQNNDVVLKSMPSLTSSINSTNIVENLLETDKIENITVSTTSGEDEDPSSLRVHELPLSPLDEFSPRNAQENVARNNHDGNFIINFDEMGECPRDCSNDLRETLALVLKDMSHVERYHQICERFTNASICVNEDDRCDKEDRGVFKMMTSGLHYMCIEQELAFNATIKCIDDEAGLVQSECDAQCQTKNLFMNWMMRTAMQDTIQQGVNGIVGAATGTNTNPLAFLQKPEGVTAGTQTGWADMLANQKPPSPQDAMQGFENFRKFTDDLCRIGDCMLDCIRSKFNTRCEGSAGTLLSEVFVRPIAASQSKLSILRPVLGSFMPEQCNYLYNNADLKKHRIDTTMDEELKRMYAEKMAKEVREKTEQDELLSNLVPLDENGVPLPRALPELKRMDSPLDISAKTLDQLILDIYGKNESDAHKEQNKKNSTAPFVDSNCQKNECIATTVSPTKVASSNVTSIKADSTYNQKIGDQFVVFKNLSGKPSSELSMKSFEVSSGESSILLSGEVSQRTSESSGDSSGAHPENFSGESFEEKEISRSSANQSSDIIRLPDYFIQKRVDHGHGSRKIISEESKGDFETFDASESSGEASGDTEATRASGEASGDLKASESSGEVSGDIETTGASEEASGDLEAFESLVESSGNNENSATSEEESSGDSTQANIYKSSEEPTDALQVDLPKESFIKTGTSRLSSYKSLDNILSDPLISKSSHYDSKAILPKKSYGGIESLEASGLSKDIESSGTLGDLSEGIEAPEASGDVDASGTLGEASGGIETLEYREELPVTSRLVEH